jgi:hypothetical protein
VDRPREGRGAPQDIRRLVKKDSTKPTGSKITSNKELVSINWPRLYAYYRYYPVQVISVLGERE